MNLTASAMPWNRPSGPSRFGPGRSCIRALIRRSTQSMIGATPRMKIPSISDILARVAVSSKDIASALALDPGGRDRLGQRRAGGRKVREVETPETDEIRNLGGEPLEDGGGREACPGGIEPGEQVRESLDARARLAGSRERGLEALQAPLHVEISPVLLRVRGDRERDVRRLGEGRVGPAEDDQEARPAQARDGLGLPGRRPEVAVADDQGRR